MKKRLCSFPMASAVIDRRYKRPSRPTVIDRRYRTAHRHPTERLDKRSNRNSSPASSLSTTSAPPKKSAASSAGSARTIRIPTSAKAPNEEQATLAGTEASSSHPQSTIQDPQSPAWPERLPDQVAILRKLIGTGDRNFAAPYDAEALSGHFGRKNKKRTEQIEGILETLKGLGQL